MNMSFSFSNEEYMDMYFVYVAHAGPLRESLYKHNYRCAISMMGHPHTSLGMSCSIRTSNSVIDGLAMAVHKIGHCIHQISVLHKVTFARVKQVRMCIQADGGHVEHLSNKTVQSVQ
jgi:hypothetical protein